MDNVHLYCILRNEAEMLPYFFRHYNQFVDKYFIWDDWSDDGSKEIIWAEPKAHVYLPDVTGLDDAYFSVVYSEKYREYSRGQCNWAIAVAVDEFIYHPNILKELEEIKALGYDIINTEGYQMFSSVFPTTQGQIYDEVYKGLHDARYSLRVVFSPAVDVAFGPGREHCGSDGKVFNSSIKLLHFRFLSEDYVRQRHARNYSRLTAINKQRGLGTHTDPMYSGVYDIGWYKQSLMEAKPCLGGN